jgi:hypothetical protein
MRRVGAARVARGAVALAVIAATLAIVGTDRAEAADGYTLESTASYVFDPTTASVSVAATYRMTNTIPDRNVGGGRVEFSYFDGLRVPIDAPADGLTELVVLVDGEPADIEQVETEGITVLDVDFPFRLRYRRTAEVSVAYRLLGAPPRTDGSFVRVNPAYASFPVYVYADDGAGDVRVDVPADWTTDYVGGEFDDVATAGDRRVFTADDIADVADFGVLFTARLDDALGSTPITVGESRFEIRAWPGDVEWQAFAERHITDGVPSLERLVGTPWPESNETDVIQASTPYLRGYAGYYFADTDVIEVGEELDAHTILHELSHAWFNDAAISERWISEGLADEIGARAAAELGSELPTPTDYDDPDSAPSDVEPFALNDWDDFDNALDDAAEYYGYRTSFVVMRALGDELGTDAMAELAAAVIAGERAYGNEADAAGVAEPIDDGDPVDWREFLDLAEQIGESTALAATYRELVVAPDDADELDRRAETLEQYGGLAQRGGAWAPPEAVRAAMADWQWPVAEQRIAEADAALDARDELATVLAPIGLEPAATTEAEYQAATDLAAIEGEIDNQRLAAARIVDARDDLTARLDAAGFDVPPLTQEAYDAEPLQTALDTETLARQAAEALDSSQDLAAALARHDLSVPALPATAFAESPEALLGELDGQLDAANTVAAAFDDRDDADSILARIGGVGSDVDSRLDAAADALARGDQPAAIDAANSASATIDGVSERGLVRLAVAALVLLLGLAGAAAWRRRAARNHAAPVPEPEQPTAV